MRVLVTMGPYKDLVLDMGTRQAEAAIRGGWVVPAPEAPAEDEKVEDSQAAPSRGRRSR